MQVIIDRMEDRFAVVTVSKRSYNIPLEWIPSGVEEGDVIEVRISVNQEETTRRREAAGRLAQDLFE